MRRLPLVAVALGVIALWLPAPGRVVRAQGAVSALGPKLEGRSMVVPQAIPGVVAAGEKVDLIHNNLKGSDGIVALPDGTVVFIEQNDVRIARINADDSLSTYVESAPRARALGVDSKGRLITLFTGGPNGVPPGYLAVVHPAESKATLAEQVEGKPLSQANDFIVSSKGGIYMTDAGTLFQPPFSVPTYLYFFPAGGGTPRRVADKIIMPNGIALSPDEKTLYVNDSRGEYMLAWDVQPDGSLTNRRNFAKYEIDSPDSLKTFPYQADGLAVDADGRVYAAMPLRVDVFSPQGKFLGKIPTSKKNQNLTFGGADRKSLYIVSQGSIWKVRMQSRGPSNRGK